MKLRSLILWLLIPMFVGCATDLNRVNAQRYYGLGLEAEQTGNYEGAREAFYRAYVNGRSGRMSAEYMSAVTYNLGRMTGMTCDFEQADKLLRESLDMEREVSGPVSGNITKRLSELARLSMARAAPKDAARYFGQAVPMLEELGILQQDPIGFAVFLDDYSEALKRAGKSEEAAQQTRRANELRAAMPGKQAQFVPVYYPERCA